MSMGVFITILVAGAAVSAAVYFVICASTRAAVVKMWADHVLCASANAALAKMWADHASRGADTPKCQP